MRTSDKTDMLTVALVGVHKELELPTKNTKGQTRGNRDYRYLNLPGLIDHLQPHLRNAQIIVLQEDVGDPQVVKLMTTIMHFSGQFFELGPLTMPAPGDPQERGKVLTYARRYALAAAFNLAADEDTDASPGMGRKQGAASADPAPAAGAVPTGEGGAALASNLATEQQWANLLSLVSGKTAEAAKRINERNPGRFYTYQTARAQASPDELEKAMT